MNTRQRSIVAIAIGVLFMTAVAVGFAGWTRGLAAIGLSAVIVVGAFGGAAWVMRGAPR